MDAALQAKAVHRIIQRSQHPISANLINSQLRKANKAASASSEQQIGHLLETISTLGLVRKMNEGLYVK